MRRKAQQQGGLAPRRLCCLLRQVASASLAKLLPVSGGLEVTGMLQPSSSLPLLQLSHVVTPCLLKAWRGRHVLGTVWLLAWAGTFAGSPQRGVWGELVPGEFLTSVC